MARNQEKAQAMLNRFLQYKKDQLYGPKGKRPAFANECNNLGEAERWRRQIVKEISKEVTEIQNASLGEHRIRDLNDHINKLLREKKHWERQIKLLGGPDYTRGVPNIRDGRGAPMGAGGYFYFGAARELPGVRELFEKQQLENVKRRTRGDLHKLVDAQYYGYGDEDDGYLVKLEAKVEEKARKRAIDKWNGQNEKSKVRKITKRYDGSINDVTNKEGGEVLFKAHVPLPSDEELKAAILAKKKAELMAKYAS
mmetsp:Transcript_24709/g.34518  ORF Transcript_24709/g.34518 Transcript_24709/m.34518 type:complete len:254 (-) Transcript_24709:225-986(-)|eukprot:CAMPEP_0185274574 /NCGR_PEP_ID=MMETSP1359-20130426/52126_1 /TAXON_ID=552665 /ORGANISM="Bigelowiella longifila, Strain CCMP242" /LENGTH=253 /DNA_ID=CAMNT_0027867603 /DNA_START=35 /DNA_END=796 /DNA_ORIENTATION=-